MNYAGIKRNYDRGLWNKQMVGMAVRKQVITAEEYQDITGEAYSGQISAQAQLEAAEAAMLEGVNSIG